MDDFISIDTSSKNFFAEDPSLEYTGSVNNGEFYLQYII